jgi:hypothetical protein
MIEGQVVSEMPEPYSTVMQPITQELTAFHYYDKLKFYTDKTVKHKL